MRWYCQIKMNIEHYWKAKPAPALPRMQVSEPGPAFIHIFVPLPLQRHSRYYGYRDREGWFLSGTPQDKGPTWRKLVWNSRQGSKRSTSRGVLFFFFWKQWIRTFLILSSNDTYILNTVTKPISRQRMAAGKGTVLQQFGMPTKWEECIQGDIELWTMTALFRG